jgi:hypothetical protein
MTPYSEFQTVFGCNYKALIRVELMSLEQYAKEIVQAHGIVVANFDYCWEYVFLNFDCIGFQQLSMVCY